MTNIDCRKTHNLGAHAFSKVRLNRKNVSPCRMRSVKM